MVSQKVIPNKILGNEIKQHYKSDNDEDQKEEIEEVHIDMNQNPAFLDLHDSEDSGLPDSACESESSSEC